MVNRKRVQRLMRLMGIEAIYQRQRTSQAAPGHRIYPYQLRGLVIERVNQVWAADIWLYSNGARLRVSGCSNGLGESLCACMAAVERARLNLLHQGVGGCPTPRPAGIFNTDQGSQFTGDEFINVLLVHGIAISMDGHGRFSDNIFVERLWRSLKCKEVYLKAYQNVAEARHGIAGYFDFYNHERLHQALGYRAPRQALAEALPLPKLRRGRKTTMPN